MSLMHRVSPPTLRISHTSNLIMIMRHQLHLHESRSTITPMMTHQPGAATGARIDLHLGQKPKLGGRYADDSLIYISYSIVPMYIHVSLSLLFLSLFPLFQNTKRPKIFPLFLFVCLFNLLPLVCFICYFRFAIWKKYKNILLCLLFPSILVSKIKNPKIFVVLLWFCKVCWRVQSSVTLLELRIHFILFKPHKWRAIMTTYDNPRCGKRLVWTLFVFIFVHIPIYVDMLSRFM
jgi:hypothetical protein